MQINLLDMGAEKYGDCLLVTHQEQTILIDGAHPGDESFIRSQLKKVLKKNSPFDLDLLIVTHCHTDHIGCLPAMLEKGYIRPRKALLADPALRWGKLTGEEDDFFSDASALLQSLQEEPRSDMSDGALEKFLSDAVDILPSYRHMIRQLEEKGVEIIYYQGAEKDYSALEAEFGDIGLKILGPTEEHLRLCFENLTTGDDRAIVADVLRSADSSASLAKMYRQLSQRNVLTDEEEGLADDKNNGAAVNDQSIVIKLKADGWSALLAGDMQWASTGVPGLNLHMKALLHTANENGPYDFIKLTHHTAQNGLSKSILSEWLKTTKMYAHTGGSEDKGHPNPTILGLLKEKENDNIVFGRTDSNGLLTIGKEDGKLKMWISRGDFNDFRPNNIGDQTTIKGPSGEIGSTSPSAEAFSPASVEGINESQAPDGIVELTAKIPHTSTKVTITVDVEPKKKTLTSADIGWSPTQPPPGGRLDNLVFVTCSRFLKTNIGEAETSRILDWVKQIPKSQLIDLPSVPSARDAAMNVKSHVNRTTKGIVIIGGYDVVPSSQLDVLEPALRLQLANEGYDGYDADNFVVWSDDIYGDLEGDSLPELPVSRIPDGKNAELVWNALNAPRFARNFKFGIRNLARPFAIDIYDSIPAQTNYNLEVSERCSPSNIELNKAQGAVYYMLHGADHDGTRFWGETKGGSVYEAFDINNIPESTPGTVIFAGCCWGALTVQPAAYGFRQGVKLRPRIPEQSIALSYLKAGALAFVGSTGTHYSPQQRPFNYFGKPMHDLFWKGIKEDLQPSQALFRAKQGYASGMPHNLTKSFSKAVEVKILREFTCLGLGW